MGTGGRLAMYWRRASLRKKLGFFTGACLCLIYSGPVAPLLQRYVDGLDDWWWQGYGGWPSGSALHRVVDLIGHGVMAYLPAGFITLFVASLALVPAGFLTRTLARERVRDGNRDPIEPARRWVESHPRSVQALTVVPAALWAVCVELTASGSWGSLSQFQGYDKLGAAASFGIVGVLAATVMTGFVRSGLRAVVAPVLDANQPPREEVAKDEIAFQAVAVTPETRTALGAMIALSAGALTLALSSDRAFRDPKMLAALVAYGAIALGGAALFRRGSRVEIGLDGVLVKGTSRTRFFPYRDLDAARLDGSDLELVRGDDVVLRVQLHGDDAPKRRAVLARIRDAIDRVKEGRGAVSAQLVSSATPEDLVRAAGGAAEYRAAALTREQLWALVEGPEIDGKGRYAAAEALARTSGASGAEERARLRVAAEQCAAPEVRIAIEKLWFTGGPYVRIGHPVWRAMLDFLDGFSFRAFGGFPAAQAYMADFVRAIDLASHPTFTTLAMWLACFAPLGFIARIVARARLRADARDPLDRLRAWMRADPRRMSAILGALPGAWCIAVTATLHRNDRISLAAVLPSMLVGTVLQYLAARSVTNAFLSPTVDPEAEARIEIGPDEIAFDAVAVTREARAAVGGLAALSVAMVAWIAALPIEVLFRDPRLFAAVAAYAAIAAAAATAFRVASRVAVGVDGVLVKGTSRTRFYAYRDLDGARVANGDIEVLRRGRVVLRLQLHGADAVRRDAVAARIQDNVARVQRGEHAVAAQLVNSSSKDQLARVASGGADYRVASLSREALWALIEGPAIGSEARRAAAEALSRTSDLGERARLRVAAEHCADPHVRVALAELAEGIAAPAEAERDARAAAART
jgi:hypothetical protein